MVDKQTESVFAALATALTDSSAPLPKPGHVATDAAAAAEGRDFLVREYGSADALDAVLHRAGRPRVGERARGASPTVRARITEHDFAVLTQLREATGRTESDVVREAVHVYLQQHQAAS